MIPSAVQSAIRDGVPPFVLLVGEAHLLVERSEQAVVEAVKPTIGLEAFNLSVHRAGEASALEAITSANTVPMMADRRLVILKDIQEGGNALFEALLEYAASPPVETVFVVSGTGFPKVRKGGSDWGRRLTNAVKKTGLVVKLSAKDIPTVPFLRDHARAVGKSLGSSAANLLVEVVGDDLGRLAQEVEKLALFAGDAEEITEEMVLQASSLVAEADVWALTASLVDRDADQALAILHRLLEEGEAEHKLLGLIGWQLRQVLEATDMLSRGLSDKEVQKRCRLRWDAFKRVKALAKAPPSAADVMHQLAVTNRLMNSHRAGGRRILEAFVLSVASG